MATYKQIQEFVNAEHGVTIKTCWIADMKELLGLFPKVASNRLSREIRTNPCPENKKLYIEDAFRHFNMI